MKVIKNKLIWFIIILLVAFLLIYASTKSNDMTLSSFGVALGAISILKILQFVRISRNPELLKKFEVSQKEERFIMIAEKSARYTLILTILIMLIASIVLMLKQNELANIFLYICAFESFAYVAIYYLLQKKY